MLLLGVQGSSGPAGLAPGEYYIAGLNTTATPHEGQGWTLTTALDDLGAGDATTGVTGASGSVTVLHVYAAPTSLTAWSQTVSYRGTMSMAMSLYNNGAWDPMSDSNGLLWGTHVGFSSETRVAGPGLTASIAFRAIFTESNQASGQTQCTDSRPTA